MKRPVGRAGSWSQLGGRSDKKTSRRQATKIHTLHAAALCEEDWPFTVLRHESFWRRSVRANLAANCYNDETS